MAAAGAITESHIFGVSLSTLPDSALTPDIFVPKIVYECVEFLRRNALCCKGLFRMAGFVQKRNIIREKVNKGVPVSFSEENGASDCHTIADLLKSYLRQLPDPPVPPSVFATYKRMITTDGAGITTSISLMARLADTALPPLNYNLLKYICLFLNNVALFHDENEMDAYNLAVIFTPNFLRLQETELLEQGKTVVDLAAFDYRAEVAFVRNLIEHADYIFCGNYQPPTRAHIKVVSAPAPPPINMSTPIDKEWDAVFEPLKQLRELAKPRTTFRPVKYIQPVQPVQPIPYIDRSIFSGKSSADSLSSMGTAASVSPTPFPIISKTEPTFQAENGTKLPRLSSRRLSQSLDMISISDGMMDSVPSMSLSTSSANTGSSNADLLSPPSKDNTRPTARAMITTVSSRINMAESEMDKLKRDFSVLAPRL